MKMPEKSPEFWVGVVLALREQGLAMMLTFILSYLRIRLYGDQPSIVRSLIEAAVGALLVMIVGLAVNSAGLNVAWTLLTGGFVGILGIEQVRTLAQKWAARKVEGQ
ncbi:phage holin, lambda family [Azotobacter beijerinckii]|uniref:Phage holin, lambda family n=1 Tax=Azotobacter beijerinckii TaxID=170623 RepID=A0A1H6V6R1_9GAMM|nr:phage holin, lambda family [Azotobacter beijerinckii]SEI98634.1 phage holin, lambda family [Azotobacter beijerinckii]